MSKTARIIVITLIALFFGGIILLKLPKNEEHLDAYTIYDGIEENGGIADHVKGNKDAKVILYEYADYQCPGCSAVNPWVNELIDEYKDQVGLVYRVYLLSYHENARAAASAVEAAGLQGYWKEYGDLLFANQSEWEYSSADERTALFSAYFTKITDGEGDVEKFQSDMASDAVSKKIDFDVSMAKAVKLDSTPALYMDGEAIDWHEYSTKDSFLKFMRELLNEKISAASKE